MNTILLTGGGGSVLVIADGYSFNFQVQHKFFRRHIFRLTTEATFAPIALPVIIPVSIIFQFSDITNKLQFTKIKTKTAIWY